MSRKLLLAALLAATACGSESAKAPEDPIGPEAQPASDGAPPGQPDPGPDPASATEPTASGQEPESPPPAIEDEQLIDVPEEVVLPEDGDDADGDSPDPIGRVSISGPLDHSRFDEDGARLLRLVAEDSRTASEGLLELTGVRLELEGQGVVLAETGRVRFESTGGRLVLGGPEDRIELEVAQVDLDASHDLAPMSLTAGALVAGLAEERLELTPGATGQRPHLDGALLQLHADELVLELAAERLAADGAVRVELLDEHGAIAHSLDAAGLTLAEPRADRLELDAHGELARLVVHAEDAADDLTLTAPRVVLGAVRRGEEELTLTSLLAHGTGQVERAGGVAVGEDLDFTFAPDGEAGRVVLHGAPVLRFADLTRDDAGELRLEADGPLELTLAGELRFATEARARATWDTWTLVTDGGLDGLADEAGGRIDLHGVGGVTLDGELRIEEEGEGGAVHTGTLAYVTEEVHLQHRTRLDPLTGEPAKEQGPGWPKVHLVGTGHTEVDAKGDQGLAAHVTCTDGMELDLAGERWTLPAGRGVSLRLESPQGTYVAQADELLGLDVETLRLHAAGDVTFEQVAGALRRVGHGGRLVLAGEDHLELVGSEGQLARYEEGASWVEARSLERLGRRVTAAGRVATHLELELMVLDLTCGRLELSGLDPDGRDLESLDKLELVRGVHGTLVMDQEALDVSATELVLLRVDEAVALPDDAGPPVLYELFGEGPVRLGWTTAEADWRVDCRSIEAFVREAPMVEPPAEAADESALDRAWFELVARGEVRVREELGDFVGLGETLHLDHAAEDRALLEGGAGPAKVSGRLPAVLTDDEVTYKGEVERLALAGGVVAADDVDVLLVGLDLPGSNLRPELVGADDSTWRVRGQRLHAEVGLVELDGSVSFEGSDQGVPMRLLADLVTFVNADLWIGAQADPESARPGRAQLDREDLLGTTITAHGSVLLRRGAEYEVSGDELSVAAETRELRLSGAPAQAIFAGLRSSSRWLRLDPVNMTLDSGPGQITVDPVLMMALERAREERSQ